MICFQTCDGGGGRSELLSFLVSWAAGLTSGQKQGRVPGGVALLRWNNFGVALERRGVDSDGLSVLVKRSTGDLATCKLLVKCWCPQRT